MIGLANPFEAQIQEAERSGDDIIRHYGPAAWHALLEGLELQREAYRMGARLQLEAWLIEAEGRPPEAEVHRS